MFVAGVLVRFGTASLDRNGLGGQTLLQRVVVLCKFGGSGLQPGLFLCCDGMTAFRRRAMRSG
ncbi:hypothetical protein [Rudaea sp.]|uniref:hypothetical protein n=1 Tax=Rudaea sp. TaxID=2136325 RepID=UPI0037837BCC